jgi:hypothetical protein
MIRFRILGLCLAATAAGLGSSPCRAQTAAGSQSAPYQVKPLPDDLSGASYRTQPLSPTETPTSFSFSIDGMASGKAIEYRSLDRMSEDDRALVAKADPAIRDATVFAGIDFGHGTWSYQQLACAALPEHILLLYKGDSGAGDVTLFSAAIPRGGKAQVRIIPIERRGFAPFSPAPVNGLAIAAFNRIRADETENRKPDWLATALCYAALTGPRPAISPETDKGAADGLAIEFTPTIQIERFGGSTVRFVDVAAQQQPMQWALTFDGAGQLIKVDHSAAPAYPIKPLP